MINNVNQGEAISATEMNKIIDVANGLQTPTNGSFVQTKNGTLFSDGMTQPYARQTDNPPFLFHSKKSMTYVKSAWDGEYDLEEKPIRSWMIRIPTTVDTIKEILDNDVKDVFLLNSKNESLDVKITDGFLKNNIRKEFLDTQMTEDKLKIVKVAIYDKEDVSDKSETSSSTTYVSSTPLETYLAITDIPSDSEIKSRMENLVSYDQDKQEMSITTLLILGIWDEEKGCVANLISQPQASNGGTVGVDSEYILEKEKHAKKCSISHDEHEDLELFDFEKSNSATYEKLTSRNFLFNAISESDLEQYYSASYLDSLNDNEGPFLQRVFTNKKDKWFVDDDPKSSALDVDDRIIKASPTKDEIQQGMPADRRTIRYCDTLIQLPPPIHTDSWADEKLFEDSLQQSSLEDKIDGGKAYHQLYHFDRTDDYRTKGLTLEYGQDNELPIEFLERDSTDGIRLKYTRLSLNLPLPPDPGIPEEIYDRIETLENNVASLQEQVSALEERVGALENQKCWETGGNEGTCNATRIAIGRTTLDEAQLQRLLNLIT